MRKIILIIVFMFIVFIVIFLNASKKSKDIEQVKNHNNINKNLVIIKENVDGTSSIYDFQNNLITTVDNSVDTSIYSIDPTFNPMP